jgi:hypothetical protein
MSPDPPRTRHARANPPHEARPEPEQPDAPRHDHGLVLSTRTAAEAAQGALLDRLDDLADRAAEGRAPWQAPDGAADEPPLPLIGSVPPADRPPDIRPAAVPRIADAEGRDELAASAGIDRVVRAYVRALVRESRPREDVLDAVDAAVREGTERLTADERDAIVAAARWTALVTLTVR